MISLEIFDKAHSPAPCSGEVVIKTCNRSEVYSGAGEIPIEVVSRLFRVVCGLESNLIGEKAIQGQVKAAYLEACENQLSSSMHKLFQRALYVGKKIRSHTGINKGAVSYSQAAVDILMKKNIIEESMKISLIGAHIMNDKIISYLLKKGASTIFLGNRTYHKAKEIADKYGSEAFSLDQLTDQLLDTDILITASSAPHYLINANNFPANKKMTIIDLAMPADVDPELAAREYIDYITLEHIENTVSQNLEKRELELEKAGRMVDEEIDWFMAYQKSWTRSPVKT